MPALVPQYNFPARIGFVDDGIQLFDPPPLPVPGPPPTSLCLLFFSLPNLQGVQGGPCRPAFMMRMSLQLPAINLPFPKLQCSQHNAKRERERHGA